MRGVLVLLLLLLTMGFGFCATTVEIDVSTASGTGACTSGTYPTCIQTDDGVTYQVDQGENMQVTAFNVAGQPGTVSGVVLHTRYLVQGGYNGNNFIQWSLDGGTNWNNSDQQPANGNAEADRSYSLPTISWADVGNLDIRFVNNDGGGNDYVRFDRVWLAVTYTVCGDAVCEGTETYSSCPADCCQSDGTSTTDTTCHSECNGINGATVSVNCNSVVVSTCADLTGYCSSTCAFTQCAGSEANCFCSGGACSSCSAGNYCSSYACPACSTTCDGVCQDSACFGTDPDCNVAGGLQACCGNSACDGSDTASNCPSDCCDADCTAATDSTCYSACQGYNGCAFADGTAQSVCNNQAFGSTVCYNTESTVLCCEASSSACAGCTDCSGGSCSTNDNTECSNSEASCYCSGTCQSCSSGNYCSAYACLTCSTTCNGVCSDSACFLTDPDCDVSGGATLSCCGNSVCASGESCSADCATETHCSDSVDNDNDGDTDSNDPDCANCGDASCTAGETYSSCPADCCESDGTGASDTICHSVCTGYNSASVSSQCNSIDVGSGSACSGTAGSCSTSCAYTACSGTEGNCYCAGGSCTSCNSNFYCTSAPVCTSCSTVCNALCLDSACYGADPDCDATGSATLACCGNSKCEGGSSESCSNCAADCGLCPTTTAGVCGNGLCEGNYNATYSESCSSCSSDCGACPITTAGVCGNGLCEGNYNATYSESCSNCITDCGICAGGTGLGACGNSVCETGENIGNCPSDCSPSSITIEMLSPAGASTYVFGEVINARVNVTYDVGIKGVNAAASITTPVGTFSMVDPDNDGVYEVNITVPANASVGAWSLDVIAKKGITGAVSRSVIIINELKASVSTDKSLYIKNNRIFVSGNVTNARGELFNSIVNISVNNEVITVNALNGLFNVSYLTNILDPSGEWLINVNVFDSYGNNGASSVNIAIASPAEGSYLTVNVVSPVQGFVRRGSEVGITIDLLLNDIKTGNAIVIFRKPDGQYGNLTEIESGRYSGTYVVPLSAPIDKWVLEVIASKDSLNGVGKVNMYIQSGVINLNVKQPTKSVVSVGETVRIEVDASYSDGTPVELPEITASVLNETVILSRVSAGVYAVNYVVGENVNEFGIDLSVLDETNNSGSVFISLSVSGVSVEHYFRKYWYITYPIIAGGVSAVVFFSLRFMRTEALTLLNKKKDELINLKKKTQESYYIDKSINKEQLSELSLKYDKELENINRKIKERKKK